MRVIRQQGTCGRGRLWIHRILSMHRSAASARTLSGARSRAGSRALDAYLMSRPAKPCGGVARD